MERISPEILSRLAKLSFQAMGQSSPNPPVAAVVADFQGNPLSEAGTLPTGKNHAEREAYSLLGEGIFDHDLFVTLEPCTHYGKTPPCRDLILEKKPRNVFLGWSDPNPLVDSRNALPYQTKNIHLHWMPEIRKVSEPFLEGFRSRIQENRPWVWFKSAVTEDGFYAPLSKETTSISGKESQFFSQVLRAKWDAILVGPGTLAHDAPSLHFRILPYDLSWVASVQEQTPSLLDPFLDGLFGTPIDELVAHMVDRTLDYQPQRLFFLGPNQSLTPEFLEKQKTLNISFGKKGCQFFQIAPKDGLNSFLIENQKKAEELSEYPLVAFLPDQGKDFLSLLAERGINTLLCEVGSFLFSFLEPFLKPEDVFLTIRNSQKWQSGWKSPGEGRGELLAKFQVGEDLWEFCNCLSR